MVAWDLETSRIPMTAADRMNVELRYLTAFGATGILTSAPLQTDASLAQLFAKHFFTPEHKGWRFVSWNGLRFDMLLLFRALAKHAPQFVIRPYVAGQGQIRGARVYLRDDPKIWWELLDGMAMTYLKIRLAEFVGMFAPDFPKLSGPDFESGEEFDSDNPEHVRYAERDSEGLYHALQEVDRIMVDLTGRGLQCTIGNAGIKFFERSLPENAGIPPVPESLWDGLFTYAMRGGYVYVARQHDGPMWQYDLNQAYAAAMRMPLPNGRAIRTRREIPGELGCYWATISRSSRSPVPFYCKTSERTSYGDPEGFRAKFAEWADDIRSYPRYQGSLSIDQATGEVYARGGLRAERSGTQVATKADVEKLRGELRALGYDLTFETVDDLLYQAVMDSPFEDHFVVPEPNVRIARDGDPFECFGDEPVKTLVLSPEVETLRRWGWDVQIHGGYTWMETFDMSAMVDRLEELRRTCPGGPKGPIGTMVKAIGNHSYGKTTERLATESVVIAGECPPDHAPWKPEEPELECFWVALEDDPRSRKRYHRPQIGAFITAYVRMWLYDAIMAAPEAFLKADTDSLAFDRPVAHLDVDPARYGAWKAEYAGERGIVIGKKCYLVIGADGREHAVCKGLSVRRLHLEDYEDWLRTGEPPAQVQIQTLGWRAGVLGDRYRVQERRGTDFRKTAPHLFSG